MAIMFDMPKSPSSQLKTVLRYFDLVKVLDLAEIDKLFADDFVQSTRPLSLGVPSRTKEEDLAFLRGFAEKLEERHLEVKKMGPLIITGLTDD
jgi:ketosteroid isomerase-like protein